MQGDSDPPSYRSSHAGGRATAHLRALGELGVIARIRTAVGKTASTGVRTGIGDDTAVLAVTAGTSLLATTDLLVEDIHFRRTWASPADIGWKAMAVNLSDIASMGGVPRWALVAAALPGSVEVHEVDALYAGLLDAAAPHGVTIVGGDTSSSRLGWTINVTLLGEHAGTPKLRSTAAPGDVVAVTGSLGRAAAGLALLESGSAATLSTRTQDALTRAHLRPTPRLAEGRWLGEQSAVHAMMDLSDGLTTDLGHICRESDVGARIGLELLPTSPAVREAASALGKDPLEWTAAGGEDYELLLTCDPDVVDRLAEGLLAATGTALTAIGRIERREASVTYVDARGEPVLLRSGYQHFHG
jgi:thiamine-monophosphate kinase